MISDTAVIFLRQILPPLTDERLWNVAVGAQTNQHNSYIILAPESEQTKGATFVNGSLKSGTISEKCKEPKLQSLLALMWFNNEFWVQEITVVCWKTKRVKILFNHFYQNTFEVLLSRCLTAQFQSFDYPLRQKFWLGKEDLHPNVRIEVKIIPNTEWQHWIWVSDNWLMLSWVLLKRNKRKSYKYK